MSQTQCKYSKERLATIVRERGVTAAIEDINYAAVGDAWLRQRWQKVQTLLDEIEQTLTGEV